MMLMIPPRFGRADGDERADHAEDDGPDGEDEAEAGVEEGQHRAGDRDDRRDAELRVVGRTDGEGGGVTHGSPTLSRARGIGNDQSVARHDWRDRCDVRPRRV